MSCFSLDSIYSTRREITLWSYTRTCNKYMFCSKRCFPLLGFYFSHSRCLCIYRCGVSFSSSFACRLFSFRFSFNLVWSFVFMLFSRSVGLRHSTVCIYILSFSCSQLNIVAGACVAYTSLLLPFSCTALSYTTATQHTIPYRHIALALGVPMHSR